MNPIDDVIQTIIDKSDRTINEDMVRNIVHWGFAIMANRKRKRIILGSEIKLMNYFGLTFNQSNSGKTWVYDKVRTLINETAYKEMIHKAFVNNKTVGPEGDITSSADMRFLTTYAPYNMESTTQGIHMTAEAMAVASTTHGSLNFVSDEFFASAKKDIMDRIVMGHEGAYQAPVIKGNKEEARYENVYDLPTNLLGMSAVDSILREPTKLGSFIGELERAWFKRSFITTDEKGEIEGKEANPDARLQESTKDYLFDFKAIEEEPDLITVSVDAEELLEQKKRAFFADKGRYGKLRNSYNALSLAGIRAVADRRDQISYDDMLYAFDFEERCYKQAVNFCGLEQPFKRAFYELSSMEMSETEMVSRKMMGSRKAERQDIVELLAQYALENNAQLHIDDERGITKYKIEKHKVAGEEVSLSYMEILENNKKGMGMFKNSPKGSFGEELMNWMGGKHIAPWTFHEEQAVDENGEKRKTNRTKDNAIQSYMICFDFEPQVDKETGEIFEMRPDTIMELFAEYNYIMRASKSHMMEGKGNRFHIYIPYEHIMDLDADTYKETYLNIAKRFGIYDYIDKSTSHRASYFTETREPKIKHYNEGKKLDYRCCIPETNEARSVIINTTYMQDIDLRNIRVKTYLAKVLNDISTGERDNTINAFVHKMMTDVQADPQDIKESLDVIKSVITFDRSFTERDMNKFYKRIGV